MLELAGGPATTRRARATGCSMSSSSSATSLERPVRQLSKGMTQKLGLASCFLAEGASSLLLDEPMSGLDPRDPGSRWKIGFCAD